MNIKSVKINPMNNFLYLKYILLFGLIAIFLIGEISFAESHLNTNYINKLLKADYGQIVNVAEDIISQSPTEEYSPF